jgi:hypothetical protein
MDGAALVDGELSVVHGVKRDEPRRAVGRGQGAGDFDFDEVAGYVRHRATTSGIVFVWHGKLLRFATRRA